MGDPTRVTIELNGEELGIVRDLLAAHADRQAVLAGQQGGGLALLRTAGPYLALCARVDETITRLPEEERPKAPPARSQRVRHE